MYENHRLNIAGTYVQTKKKHHKKHNFPFLRLSNGARRKLPWDWYWEAALKVRVPSGREYYIQATYDVTRKESSLLPIYHVCGR